MLRPLISIYYHIGETCKEGLWITEFDLKSIYDNVIETDTKDLKKLNMDLDLGPH